MRDLDLLALYVHRDLIGREEARGISARVLAGQSLDEALEHDLGWTPAKVLRMRRTRGGEIPEIPGFEILEKLGTGGTADVFRAREKARQRILALKVLKPTGAGQERVRKSFIAEGRMLEKLQHPGLVRCHGVARSGNVFFSKLECVEGKTLLELLDAQRSFTESEALRIILAASEVLRYLSEQGIVHRDVKPGNVMLTGAGRVVLIDLGFAATADTRGPEDSTVGTVAYLSPEQACGGAAADPRSDIYSLGISLFHLVVGRLPFQGSDDREVLRMQVMDSLSSPELKGRGISPHAHYFIEKMVAKDAAARYQSWAELIDDIRAQVAGREDLDFERDPRSRR